MACESYHNPDGYYPEADVGFTPFIFASRQSGDLFWVLMGDSGWQRQLISLATAELTESGRKWVRKQ